MEPLVSFNHGAVYNTEITPHMYDARKEGEITPISVRLMTLRLGQLCLFGRQRIFESDNFPELLIIPPSLPPPLLLASAIIVSSFVFPFFLRSAAALVVEHNCRAIIFRLGLLSLLLINIFSEGYVKRRERERRRVRYEGGGSLVERSENSGT